MQSLDKLQVLEATLEAQLRGRKAPNIESVPSGFLTVSRDHWKRISRLIPLIETASRSSDKNKKKAALEAIENVLSITYDRLNEDYSDDQEEDRVQAAEALLTASS